MELSPGATRTLTATWAPTSEMPTSTGGPSSKLGDAISSPFHFAFKNLDLAVEFAQRQAGFGFDDVSDRGDLTDQGHLDARREQRRERRDVADAAALSDHRG